MIISFYSRMVAVYILQSFRFFCWLTITPFLLEGAKLRIMIEKPIHCERNYSEKFYRGFRRCSFCALRDEDNRARFFVYVYICLQKGNFLCFAKIYFPLYLAPFPIITVVSLYILQFERRSVLLLS